MGEGRKVKLSERTADRLCELIMDERQFTPGSKLPNENELSEALHVSRTTLREAISFLVAQGVLEIRRGKGTFVTEDLPASAVDLTALSNLRSRVRARDLFEMRLIFEPATVALACQRATDEELAQIRQKAERMERIAKAGGDWPLADQEFHMAIIKASHNEYMRRLYPIINGAVNEILQVSVNRAHMQSIAIADNYMILDFLMQRDEAGARHAMSMVAALLFERFQAGAAPLAVVSMDNCSHNGEKLQSSVMTVAKAWAEKGYVGQDFIAYLEDESKIAFPWSMIDKITPRPHKIVEEQLVKDNIEDMEPIVTSKNTFIAAFVNAERPQYLVIEDKFPNGRPALEKAGVYLTDRDTVNKTERMKVTTCLNPLHTAMSVYGCMLGYTLICDEMKDADIVALIKRLGYVEGLPVVVNPGILEPKAFIDEVVEQRLPNPFMPDAPQRIATDTSQKVGIRFGETIKSYVAEGRDLNTLVSIPLAIAGWLRYLLAVDDNGNAFEVSADPLKDDLQAKLATIKFGDPDSCTDQLDSILSNASIFGSDLTKTVLADKVKAYFKAEIAGPGAVRKTLHDAVNA